MRSVEEDMSFSIRSMLDVAPCGVLIFRADESMSIVATNKRLWNLFACACEEEFLAFCGGDILNLVAPVDRESVRGLMQKTMELDIQKMHRYFYHIVTKGGRELEIEDCGGLVYSEKGTVLIVCHFFETAGVSIRSGSYKVHSKGTDIMYAYDMAKTACDAIHDTGEVVMVYDAALEKRVQLEKHILEHFDEAMREGYIKPYYQPVIRTITNSICGTEALARWIDPELGYISPADFIPILESNHLITTLDLFILEQICINIKKIEQVDTRVQPTSFNLSKRDFVERNMLEAVEEIVSRYGVARDMIQIEISESMVLDDPERLKQEIVRFQAGGYRVVMDDFGSGYASLNVLKEYPFDEIKLDMFFLRTFDEKSKEMLRASIRMAKRLGIQTLAEGVETKEQYAFLQEIGCEKVQGYYFSKPLPAKEIMTFAQERNFNLERKADRHYYDQIGKVNRDTDRTLAIVEYDQKNFRFLYRNKEFLHVGTSLGIEHGDVLEYMINSPSSTLSRKLRYLQEKAKMEDEFAEMDFSIHGQYFRLRSRRISENFPLEANQVEIYRFSNHEIDDKSEKLDVVFREMYSMYDIIFLIHPDGQFENLMRSSMSKEQDKEKLRKDGVIVPVDIVKEYIHPDDRKEFLRFIDYKGLRKRLMTKERGFETKYFRSNLGRTGYTWKAHTLQYIPESDKVIFSTKLAPLKQDSLLEKLGYQSAQNRNREFDESLLERLKYSETINFFWKDTERRFLGASKKFYRTMGIADESLLIGKTDQDFHWILNDSKSIQDEILLLEHGMAVHEKIEKCIIQGVTHTVLTSKEPIYQGDQIVGLLCGFVDVDELLQKENGFSTLNYRDSVTGLLSAQGIIDSVYGYIEGWTNRHENFAIIRIKFLEQKHVYEEYGSAIANKIAQSVASVLRGFDRTDLIIARLYAGNYVLLQKYEERDEVAQFVDELSATMKNIHELAGYEITMYPKIDVHFADQVENTRKLIAVATGGTDVDLQLRKQLEDKLNYYNIQLDTIVDSLPGGIAILEMVDEGMQLVYASSGVGKLSGRSIEDFLNRFAKTPGVDVVSQDLELVSKAMQEAVEKGTDLNITYRVKHINGNLIWINMQGRTIGEQNGHPLFLAVYRSLSESTSIYEAILDASQEYVLVRAKADGEILYANNAAVQISEKLSGGVTQQLYELVAAKCTPDKRSDVVEESGQKRTRYEVVINDKNLLVYYVDGVWNGREAVICYIFDITAKYTEERAKAARASLLYFEAINSSYDLIITYNLTKNYYNVYSGEESFLGYKWTGYATYDDLIDAVVATIPEDGSFDASQIYAKNQLANYLSGNHYALFEHKAIDADGNMHWLSDRVVYVEDPDTGDVLAISLTMFIDDEVRQRNEQQNILKEALEEANSSSKAKSQFLSNMSHDIRTPMNAIMGYASIAKSHSDDLDRIEDCINKILYSGKHLQDLINDVLDMSRIESGKDVIERKSTDFRQMTQDVYAIIAPLAKEKDITIKADISKVVHMDILADMSKIRRVMVNILSNAVKFTENGGQIQCTLSEIDNAMANYGTYIFRVKDNGVGMSPEFLEHIFDVFAREKTSTVSQLVGSGLGMAIAKRYVDLMGGTITVNSTQGVGTEVTVTLDLEWSAHQASEEAVSLDNSAKLLVGKRVLVVDDNRLNREIARIMLNELGLITDIALDGQMAIDLINQGKDGLYDFILMDMQMPVMDGVTATKILRASERTYLQKVPIIALTANAFTEDIKTCLAAGMNAHIAKPFEKETFVKEMVRFIKPKSA